LVARRKEVEAVKKWRALPIIIIAAMLGLQAACQGPSPNVLTQHNDNSRSGAYLAETHLTPANVNTASFGKLYERNVDGDTVAQPLYLRSVQTSSGTKNLFFVTTSKNIIYAFDAENMDQDPTHGLVWQRQLCSSVQANICSETWSGLVGITSTPVIDAGTNSMYVVARCSDGSNGPNDGAIYIYDLNVGDSTDRVTPLKITATDPNGVNFDFHCERNRPGLLLSNGVIYAGFGTFSCDQGCPGAPYHGWVLGYRSSDLTQVAVFDTSPKNGGLSGIWQTGNGLAAGGDGSIYVETGNGPTSEPLQDSFVKLAPSGTAPGLTLAGSFSPNNSGTLAAGDTDLGSGGPNALAAGPYSGWRETGPILCARPGQHDADAGHGTGWVWVQRLPGFYQHLPQRQFATELSASGWRRGLRPDDGGSYLLHRSDQIRERRIVWTKYSRRPGFLAAR